MNTVMKDQVTKDEHSQGSSHQGRTATKALVTKDEQPRRL